MTEHRIDLDDAQLYARTDGSASAPALLLLSGARCTTGMWTPVMGELAARFHVVRFDIRGTGHSVAKPGAQYGLDRYADDAAAVLDALGIDRVLVWGMAFGSRVALAFASRHLERVVGLALYDASLERPDTRAQRDGAAAAVAIRAELGIAEVQRDPTWFAHDDEETLRLSLAAAYADQSHSRYGEGITVPVLIATGDHDPNLEPSRRLAAHIDGAELRVLEAVGHGSVVARPDLCLDVFVDFVERRVASPNPGAAGPGGPGGLG